MIAKNPTVILRVDSSASGSPDANFVQSFYRRCSEGQKKKLGFLDANKLQPNFKGEKSKAIFNLSATPLNKEEKKCRVYNPPVDEEKISEHLFGSMEEHLKIVPKSFADKLPESFQKDLIKRDESSFFFEKPLTKVLTIEFALGTITSKRCFTFNLEEPKNNSMFLSEKFDFSFEESIYTRADSQIVSKHFQKVKKFFDFGIFCVGIVDRMKNSYLREVTLGRPLTTTDANFSKFIESDSLMKVITSKVDF